jgi:ParB family chromosome partitioning protein
MRRALGRGLGALFPEGSRAAAVAADMPPEDDGRPHRLIPIGSIRPNPCQPRQSIGDDGIAELASSIRQHGVIQPVLVRTLDDGFELIAGERRWRAARLAGLEQLPAVVRETTDAESFEIALIENLQRQDLSPLEEAEAYRRLVDEFGLTQDEVSARVGKNRATVANLIRLLGLPDEVKHQIASGALTMGHARALLAASSPARQVALAKDVARRGMSVRDVERLARSERVGRTRPHARATDVHTRAVEDELCRLMGTRVRLVPRGRGGCIEISYHSPDELERLLGLFREWDPVGSNSL